MIKLLLTLLMMFIFGTSTVNAEENTTNIEDRIDELTLRKPDNESAIKAKVEELSEDELKAIIENINELTEPTEDDLIIKEAASNKLGEMGNVKDPLIARLGELSPLIIGLGVLGVGLMFSSSIMVFKGHDDGSMLSFVAGMILIGLATLLWAK